MNADNKKVSLIAGSLDDTMRLGATIGSNLKGGEIIELLSDLGGGKTTITKAIVKGTGSSDLVSSPSFTICNEYQAEDFRIYHFDFYRLSEPGIIKQELEEVLNDSTNVILIEWPDTIEKILPRGKIVINLLRTDETKRRIDIVFDEAHSYIVKDLK